MISQKYELAANKSMLKILDFAVIFKMNYLNFWNRIQGTINCAILESRIGESGDPRRKWEEMGEQERERESE